MSLVRRFRRFIMDVLGFSRTETNGFLVLLFLVFILAIVPRVYFNFYTPDFGSNESMKEWVAEMEKSINLKEERQREMEFVPKRKNIFVDPNIDSAEKLSEIGIPNGLASRIVNYREKGGRFKRKEDLRKIYGFSENLFEQVKTSIRIPEVNEMDEKGEPANYYSAVEFGEDISFDLNLASIEQLRKVRGIGPVLGERILKYRELLGGYQDIIQLNEVYGLSPEVINEVAKHASLSGEFQYLPINQIDSIKVLAKHPYIDYNLARAIINYRTVHGEFTDVDQLKNIKVLDDSLYHKIAPYLSL